MFRQNLTYNPCQIKFLSSLSLGWRVYVLFHSLGFGCSNRKCSDTKVFGFVFVFCFFCLFSWPALDDTTNIPKPWPSSKLWRYQNWPWVSLKDKWFSNPKAHQLRHESLQTTNCKIRQLSRLCLKTLVWLVEGMEFHIISVFATIQSISYLTGWRSLIFVVIMPLWSSRLKKYFCRFPLQHSC